MNSRYFRLSLTNHCNLSCYFCHNEGQLLDSNLDSSILTAKDIIWSCKLAYNCGFRKFKLTGGEPTLRKDLFEIVEGLKAAGIADLSMITNGSTLYKLADKLQKHGLPRLNVSLYSLDKYRFANNNGGSLKLLNNIINGIDKAIQCGFANMKINYVFHGGDDDIFDLYQIINFCKERNLVLVLLPLLPYNLKSKDIEIKLTEIYDLLKIAGIINEEIIFDEEGIRKRLITLKNGARILLRIDELGANQPYPDCKKCKKHSICKEGIYPIRLSYNGVLRPCLAGGKQDIDLLRVIQDRDEKNYLNVLQSI